ncbi:hypothetical protein [Streptomyces lonarensis]|uniref:FtsK domain-containing protein n=1 Tax=Streptomyces lonarensis TaxID=700599 RepID=A0A7X6CX89_9ACTN|nr:hypothetical protein [Streptomyces lonarensis]NJQ04269.1 hypothetical protein [Streptomyces lonarensis]
MSQATATADVIDLTDRLAKRGAPAAARAAVQATEAGAADAQTGTLVVERPTRSLGQRALPAWAVVRTSAIGFIALGQKVWDYQQGGEWARQIHRARLLEARGEIDETEGEALVVQFRADRREARYERHREPATILGASGATSYVALLLGVAALWGAIGAGIVLAPLWGVLYVAGRRELADREERAAIPGQGVEAVEAAPAPSGEPEFRLGMTVEIFEDMVRRALTEDLKVALTSLQAAPHEWGFEIDVVLSRMTPETISRGLDLLEACLPGVRTGSILMQQSMAARNRCVIRVPGPNPWRAVPPLPARAPKSLSVAEVGGALIGADMSARPLALPVHRTNINVVGKSRSGKSTLLRALLDAITATRDQIVIGVDLGSAGSGFGGLRRGMHAVATTAEDASLVLRWALDVGKGRPALFDQLGMGENWQSSEKRPGVTIVVDEFPALVRESRKGYTDEETGRTTSWDLDGMLAELAITSAKSDVTIVIAGQGVTREKIKDNTWVVELPVQVMAACDADDVKQIMGGGAMAQGWRPDRLMPAMGEALNDASVVYVMAGAQYAEPIPYRACYAPDEELIRRGTERAEAGLVDIDTESAALSETSMDVILSIGQRRAARGVSGLTVPALILAIRRLFAAAGDPAGMSREELAEALAGEDPARWALAQHADEAARADALRDAIADALAPEGKAWPLEKYRKDTPRGYRLRDLRALVGEHVDGS